MDILSPEVDTLISLIDEATRASTATLKRFVEPALGTLDRAKSQRHHIVFGRRGSGKSSLIKKANAELSVQRKPTAYVNVEIFKGQSYPDVLLSILVQSLSKFEEWIDNEGTISSTRLTFWQKLFGSRPSKPPIAKTSRDSVKPELQQIKKELESLLFKSDNAALTVTSKTGTAHKSGIEAKASGGTTAVSFSAGGGIKSQESTSLETIEQSHRSKFDYLQRSVIRFQRTFEALSRLGGGSAFLFLDDLYHLRRADQPKVLDYFHRIAKDCGVWIKVGTIRHRTEHYWNGNPPQGMKIGDDADAIDLDLTLEKYYLTKDFLLKIFDGFIQEAIISGRSEIMSDAAVERLVLASGGVVRDFLKIFTRSVEIARERTQHARSSRSNKHEPPKIGAEDVNRAAGEHDSSKREELRTDSRVTDLSYIESTLHKIRNFCLNEANANCFLIQRDANPKAQFLVDELVDFKMLHLIKSRETVSKKQGQIFIGYMLDLSQYTGIRTKRDLEKIEFWNPSSREDIRKTTLIFNLETLAPEITELDKAGVAEQNR